MQGELNEIDIRSILQLIELGQRTGELFVEAYGPAKGGFGRDRFSDSSASPSWLVFFDNGRIIYAGTSSSDLLRLRDYLRRYGLEETLDRTNVPAIATINAPEYGYLWNLLENHLLTPNQGRAIVQSMVRETLFDLLSLHQGSFIFEIGPSLAPQLITLEINPLVKGIMKQVQAWKQLHPHIQSPNQCPIIVDALSLRETLTQNAIDTLSCWADGKTSIRQISRYLSRDIVTVAKAVYPYIQQGTVHLPPITDLSLGSYAGFSLPAVDRVPRIVCIDDGLTLRHMVEEILHQHGYEVTAIGNPVKALGLVFQLRPDLILCDIAMPNLDGYEICAMLRKSTAFRQIPIVMLTGKDGFIDRVRARMVGATNYLTKPFGKHELLMLVEKYVGVGKPNRLHPNTLLEEAIEDELKIDISRSTAS
ncbi:MAG: response regulator [Elainellaceae cyanobacterium]